MIETTWSARRSARGTVARAAATWIVAAVLACASSGAPCRMDRIGPSARDVIEFTRIVRLSPYDNESVRISPNRRRAFIVTRQGELDADRTVYRMMHFDIDPVTLSKDQAPTPRVLLKVHGADDNHFLKPLVQDAYWADDRTIVLKARIADAPHQVYRLDADSGALTQLTFAPHGVETFVVSGDLSRVVYLTLVPNPPMRPGDRSVVVGNQSFW